MTGIIIQARCGSSRLPSKVLLEVCGQTVLEHLLDRVSKVRNADKVIVATSTEGRDNPIEEIARRKKVEVFRGSENDVLDRFYQAANQFNLKTIVRLTADCPLADPEVLDEIITRFLNSNPRLDYLVTGLKFPEGINAEVFTRSALETAWQEARLASEREHVTSFIWNRKERFRQSVFEPSRDLSNYRFTLDEEKDWQVIKSIFEALYQPGKMFYLKNIVQFLGDHPEVAGWNSSIVRNEGYAKSVKHDKEFPR